MKNSHSLRRRFLRRVLLSLLVIVLFSSVIQLYLIKKQITNNVKNQANMVSRNIMDGISKTEMASNSIEHQIDLKMIAYAKNVSLMLKGKTLNEITTSDLVQAKDQLGLKGITLFARKNNDIVGVKSTESAEIGFSFKKFGPEAYNPIDRLLKGESPHAKNVSYQSSNILVLPIARSGSHNNTPVFNKYAYYHSPGTNYIIDPYIESDQVYKFTKRVGPNAQIKDVMKSNPNVKEIAVLHPMAFKKPSLAKSLYSPLKQVEYGSFKLKTDKDITLLKKMATDPHQVTDTEEINGKRYYQMYIPAQNGRMIYVAFDYKKMTLPLYQHSIILLLTGLLSLVILFLVTASFFNKIYGNIQKIKGQLHLLEKGDLTATSDVQDGSELEDLSKSTNRMADRLHQLIKDTQEQADKTQRLSELLESDAAQSTEQIYQLSSETTLKSREQFYQITEFLNEIEEFMQTQHDNETAQQIQQQIEDMRKVANDRTATTTDMTITLSDLLKQLHEQSRELSEISSILMEHMKKFAL